MRLGPMSGEVAALAVLTATLQLAAPTAAVENGAGSGVTMQLWDNSAMAGTPTSVTSSAPLSHAWDAVGPQSALWTGSLLPPSTTTYNFSCTFLNGYGLAWVDGHLMCHDGMPLYAHLIGAGPLRLAANTPVPIRLQFVRNDTTKAQASAALLWAINPSPDSPQFSGQPKHDGAPQNGLGPIPSSALQMAPASKAEAAMEALQMEQYTETAGWGSWYPHNLICVTRLPDGAQITFGLCQLSSNTCQLVSIESSFSIRLGPHAVDGSYAQLYQWWGGGHWDGGVNVSVSWSTVVNTGSPLHDLRLSIEAIQCGNCSNYAIVVVPSFEETWSGAGVASVDAAAKTLTLSPLGTLPSTTIAATGPILPSGLSVNVPQPHLAFAVEPTGAQSTVVLSSVKGEAPETTLAAIQTAEKAERATYAAYGTPELAELKEAVQASVMWLAVYVPYSTGPILTISRGSMGGGSTQCDWDNFFAAMMLGSDQKGFGLGVTAFAQTLGTRTVDGFVPNCASGFLKSRDRTEPIVGAKVLKAFVKRFGMTQTGWVVDWAFDKLYGWHDWAWDARRLVYGATGLIAPGTTPLAIPDPTNWGANTMQGARWETGMDNSPMYDGPDSASHNLSGPVLFSTTDHMMQLWDVGMTANLASDMLALAALGDEWCAAGGSLPSNTTEPCTAATKAKIATLKDRAGQLATLTQTELWSDTSAAFVNKMPKEPYNLSADTFYPRISPTSFYPLMTGVPTVEQANATVLTHLLNPTGFCVTPPEQWPPSVTPPTNNAVLLQSWQFPAPAPGPAPMPPTRVIICLAGDTGAGVGGVASCASAAKAGATFHRNESYAWSAQALNGESSSADRRHRVGGQPARDTADRTPLYLYTVNGNDTVLGRAGDFPASTRVSSTPVVWVAASEPQPGAWPLLLWRSASSVTPSGADWRVTGGPESANEVAGDRSRTWVVNATLGYALPLPTACYWGLPSISFDDPAFATPGSFVYWRGNAWAPLAMLVYWGLDHPAYANVASVQVARKGLANGYSKMWMETAWRPSRTVCENYCVHEAGGCCGDTFYHWGALAGFMTILEAGK